MGWKLLELEKLSTAQRDGSGLVLLRKSLRGDEVVQCPVLRKLGLTARETLRPKAGSDRVRRLDETQNAETALFRSRVKYYEWQAVLRSTTVFSEKTRAKKRESTGSSSSGSVRGSSKKPERECNRTNHKVSEFVAQNTKKVFGL